MKKTHAHRIGEIMLAAERISGSLEEIDNVNIHHLNFLRERHYLVFKISVKELLLHL